MSLIKKASDELENKILKAIKDYNMLQSGDTVIVGVSGGSDSMLLLHFLLKFSKRLKLKIIAAHVNHCLRGEESDRDEEFVRSFCEANDILFKLLKVDVKKTAKERKQGLEECGRDLRYKFFESLNSGCYKIATAHNLSDNAETVLLNLARGSGVSGLLGIKAQRNNIIRPLLYLKKEEIKSYCDENNISYVEDSSNFVDDYTRNKIRLKIAPVLKEINLNFENNILNMGNILRMDNDYLNELSSSALSKALLEENKYDLKILNKLSPSLKARCIRSIVSKFDDKLSISYQKVNIVLDLMEKGSGTLNLFKDVFIEVKRGRIFIFNSKNEDSYWEINLIKDNIILTVGQKVFIIKVVEKTYYDDLLKKCKNIAYCALDLEKVPEGCVLRNRREHDTFRPCNRNLSKSLKKFFNEQKLELSKRYKLSMIAKGNKILWIESFGGSDEAKVTEKTRKVLLITEGTDSV